MWKLTLVSFFLTLNLDILKWWVQQNSIQKYQMKIQNDFPQILQCCFCFMKGPVRSTAALQKGQWSNKTLLVNFVKEKYNTVTAVLVSRDTFRFMLRWIMSWNLVKMSTKPYGQSVTMGTKFQQRADNSQKPSLGRFPPGRPCLVSNSFVMSQRMNRPPNFPALLHGVLFHQCRPGDFSSWVTA